MARMRKRARLTPDKPKKNKSDPEDYITSLPDHVLVSILSSLSVKDACVTSTLSKQWQYLWTYVRALNFDDNDTLNRIAADPKILKTERAKYINWVNRVVRQHRGVVLDAFKISFDLDKSSKSAIDKWIKFAIGKRVQCLELELLENGETLRQPNSNYTFPYKLLKNVNSSFSELSTGLKNLKALVLRCVNVNEEALDCFLSSCSNLRHLSIHDSGDLRTVKVSGFTLALKHLEIIFCLGIESIEISNVNLVSFSYVGTAINLIVSNVPMLKEVSIGEGYSGFENNVLGQLSCCLYQLELLTLDIHRPYEDMMDFAFPVLPNLKQLVLRIGAWDDDCLLEFTSLIKACPRLDRFVLQFMWMTPIRRRRKLREAAKSPHEFLKTVEIVGYYGRVSDAEMAMYFIQNAVNLEKIIIDPRNLILERSPVGISSQMKKEESGRKFARKQLESKTPPGVQLIIL